MSIKVSKIIQAAIIIIVAILFPPARLMLFVGFAFLKAKDLWIMAFSDPHDINYKRKTDKELYTFVLSSCIMAFFLCAYFVPDIYLCRFIILVLLYFFHVDVFQNMEISRQKKEPSFFDIDSDDNNIVYRRSFCKSRYTGVFYLCNAFVT